MRLLLWAAYVLLHQEASTRRETTQSRCSQWASTDFLPWAASAGHLSCSQPALPDSGTLQEGGHVHVLLSANILATKICWLCHWMAPSPPIPRMALELCQPLAYTTQKTWNPAQLVCVTVQPGLSPPLTGKGTYSSSVLLFVNGK